MTENPDVSAYGYNRTGIILILDHGRLKVVDASPGTPAADAGAAGDAELTNYRYRAPYYIVDRLFGAAELRLGGDKAQIVRINRTDGIKRAGAPS